MNNISSVSKLECFGCMACVEKCPKQCIRINKDEEGFLYPNIDEKICIDCGICLRTCPLKSENNKYYPKKGYAIQIKEENDLKKSSSGGIAFKICKSFIENGGVSYGAVYDKNFNVIHKRATSIKELQNQQGSKYVQSSIKECFSDLKKDCIEGKKVVFIGTPCQVAAIRKYLDKDFNNLLLIDLICHGVPSPKIFKEYINWKEKKIKGKIIDYKFRDKTTGWGTNYCAVTEHSFKKGSGLEEPFYADFILGKNYRESCYRCCFASKDRIGDITIGDYWGIDKYYPNSKIDTKKGVSCMLVNSFIGEKYINELLPKTIFFESPIDNIINSNDNLRHPAVRPEIRNIYYKILEKKGYGYIKLCLLKNKSFYKSWILRHIPYKVKKTMKKLRRMIK